MVDCVQGSDEYLPLHFYQDGEQLQLLNGQAESIDITCPIRILHGMRDTIVPYSCSTKLLSCLKSADVHLTLIKVCSMSAKWPCYYPERISRQPYLAVASLVSFFASSLLLYVQDGDHQLSRPQDLSSMLAAVQEMEDY